MAWYDEAVFYHIYPLGLTGAPRKNEYKEPVNRMKDLLPWIRHMKETGFNAVYIGPLFESVGHGYETTDYRKLDSRLGTNEDLKEFVRACHDDGIKVVFDGVFNHVGRDFFAFKNLMQRREHSQYRDWFCNVNFGGNNEYNDGFSYDNWGGYNLLVKLNQRNPAVKDYICDVIRFWVSEFDIDGIRLDAADVLDFDFMKMLRQLANTVKTDFWLMGEVIHGDYTRWVNGETLHCVTNYNLYKALYSGHNEHNYFEIAHTVKRLYEMGGNRPDGLRLYNFADNHDVERIATRLNNKAHLFPVYIMVYTLPGVPSVYYGSEFAIEGRKEQHSDDSLRPALNLSDCMNPAEDHTLMKIIAILGKTRQRVPALSYGIYRELLLTNRQYAFARSYEGVDVIVTVNNDDKEAQIYVSGVADGIYTGVISGCDLEVRGGSFCVSVPAGQGEVWLPEKADADENGLEICDIRTQILPPTDAERTGTDEEQTGVESIGTDEGQTGIEGVDLDEEQAGVEREDSATSRYHLDRKYASISTTAIASRCDYDNMTVCELQVAILEKMAKNGPVTDQMIKTVLENEHMGSLRNWVRSFR